MKKWFDLIMVVMLTTCMFLPGVSWWVICIDYIADAFWLASFVHHWVDWYYSRGE